MQKFWGRDISRYNDELWIGHCNRNVMKLCPTYGDIVEFCTNIDVK